MKAIYKSILVMIFFISITGFSQETTVEQQVSGTWTIDYDLMIKSLAESSKANLESMDQGRKTRILSAYKGRQVTYSVDGSYYQLLADGRDLSGTWQLIENDSQIEVTGPDGKTKLYQEIIKLSDDRLILRPIVEADKTMTIPTWYFTKS